MEEFLPFPSTITTMLFIGWIFLCCANEKAKVGVVLEETEVTLPQKTTTKLLIELRLPTELPPRSTYF